MGFLMKRNPVLAMRLVNLIIHKPGRTKYMAEGSIFLVIAGAALYQLVMNIEQVLTFFGWYFLAVFGLCALGILICMAVQAVKDRRTGHQ